MNKPQTVRMMNFSGGVKDFPLEWNGLSYDIVLAREVILDSFQKLLVNGVILDT